MLAYFTDTDIYRNLFNRGCPKRTLHRKVLEDPGFRERSTQGQWQQKPLLAPYYPSFDERRGRRKL
jgi:hypothetical protein